MLLGHSQGLNVFHCSVVISHCWFPNALTCRHSYCRVDRRTQPCSTHMSFNVIMITLFLVSSQAETGKKYTFKKRVAQTVLGLKTTECVSFSGWPLSTLNNRTIIALTSSAAFNYITQATAWCYVWDTLTYTGLTGKTKCFWECNKVFPAKLSLFLWHDTDNSR